MSQGNRTPCQSSPTSPGGKQEAQGDHRHHPAHRLHHGCGVGDGRPVPVDSGGRVLWAARARLGEKLPSGQASHQQHCHLLSFAECLPRGRDRGQVRGYTVVSAPTALQRRRFVQMTHEESRSNSCSPQGPPRLLTNSLGGSGAHWALTNKMQWSGNPYFWVLIYVLLYSWKQPKRLAYKCTCPSSTKHSWSQGPGL